jgi:hypothetical protein
MITYIHAYIHTYIHTYLEAIFTAAHLVPPLLEHGFQQLLVRPMILPRSACACQSRVCRVPRMPGVRVWERLWSGSWAQRRRLLEANSAPPHRQDRQRSTTQTQETDSAPPHRHKRQTALHHTDTRDRQRSTRETTRAHLNLNHKTTSIRRERFGCVCSRVHAVCVCAHTPLVCVYGLFITYRSARASKDHHCILCVCVCACVHARVCFTGCMHALCMHVRMHVCMHAYGIMHACMH